MSSFVSSVGSASASECLTGSSEVGSEVGSDVGSYVGSYVGSSDGLLDNTGLPDNTEDGEGEEGTGMLRYAVVLAVVSMCFVAVCNFTFGRALDGAGDGAPLASMHFALVGSGLVGGLYVASAVVFGKNQGTGVREVSVARQAMVGGAAIESAIGVLCLTLAFEADQASKGAVVSISAGSAALAALVSSVLFKEHIGVRQWGAIAVVTLGVVLLALATSRSSSAVPIAFGFVTLICFAGSSLTIKAAVRPGKGPLPSCLLINLIYAVTQMVVGMTTLLIRSALGAAFSGLSDHQAWLCFAAGVLLGLGTLFYNVALKFGHAGVCLAISQANGACVLLLDMTVGLFPTWFQVIGIVVTLSGVASLSILSHNAQLQPPAPISDSAMESGETTNA